MASLSTSESDAALAAVSPRISPNAWGELIQFQTISYEDPAQFDHDAFTGLHQYLGSRLPRRARRR